MQYKETVPWEHDFIFLYAYKHVLLPFFFLFFFSPSFMLTLRSVTGSLFKRHVRSLATAKSFFPDEPKQPIVKTSIPGPKSKEIMSRLNQYQDTRSIFFVAGKLNYLSSYLVLIT